MKSDLTKRQFKTALEKGNVYMTEAMQTRNGTTGYNVYVMRSGKLHKVYGIGLYWNNSKGFYHCATFGTSRSLEIILDIGYSLGLEFDENRQNYRFI